MPKKLTIKEFIDRSNKVHNSFYEYSKVEYINSKVKVQIICPKHGVFYQKPDNHLRGQSCPSCKFCHNKQNQPMKLNIFIEKSQTIHHSFFNYSKVSYKNTYTKVYIVCPIHKGFWQTPHNHLKGQGCPTCCQSKGEKQIEQWLKEQNIQFVPQKRFKECCNKRPLPFDFYLPEINTCIEYDGEQHFTPFRLKDKKKALLKFQSTKKHDKIKTSFCKENNIHLIRIRFDEKQIHNILANSIAI